MLPDSIKKKVVEYTERVLLFKKEATIIHFQGPLEELYHDRRGILPNFVDHDASFGIRVALQPAWCECSIWQVEKLLQSLFSKVPVNWFRASSDPLIYS